jgi:hypothetical protein
MVTGQLPIGFVGFVVTYQQMAPRSEKELLFVRL